MKVDEIRALFGRVVRTFSYSFAAVCLLATPQVFAQESDAGESDADEGDVEEVVVTGSRLKRDTYSSISPLQVISGQVSREVGLVDPSTILQEAPSASGVQIDLTFGAFVVDNGPGASTVDLRGLGAARTLFLVNGRRLAPSGVEGSPTSPDTNLIPGSLVQQYEVLLDGASSVYGSDALAGVVNVILRKDFDGFEFEAFSNVPASGYSAGNRNQLSATWGYNGDRGFIGIGAEYREIDNMTLADRKWSAGCERHAEITTDGEIRTEDQFYSIFYGQRSPGDCKVTGLAGYMTELSPGRGFGSMFYQPGFENTEVPNFSSWRLYSTNPDLNQDGVTDVSFADYNFNGNTQYLDVIPELETQSALAYGEYTFSGEANLTPYFELQYGRRKSSGEFFAAQLFPTVNALNPFNPCNPLGAGVDCGLAYDAFLLDPVYAAQFAAVQGITPDALPFLFTNGSGPIPVQPVVQVAGDRGENSTDVKQYRAVAGIRGDMPFINFGSVENFSFDFYISSTESDGDSEWNGTRGDRLNLALGNFSTTGTPCVNDTGEELEADVAPGCVPVNMFAPSLYASPANNDFATAAERNYVFGQRLFNTKYTQEIASFYMNGDILSLPGGDVMFGLGAEYRTDEIDSRPNAVAGKGLFFGFSADQGAIGEKYTREFFAEVEAPLLAGVTAFKELTVNLSTRHTKDEFYGGAWTYSGKLAWRPVDSLLIRSTVGTSYRAPNMRENFLAGQTGFSNFTDPCVIPDGAFDLVDGYDPAADQRSPEVIANCVADPNVDPFTFDNGGIQTYSVEVSAGGATDLSEEKSDSFSAGFTWEQPFFSAFDLVFGATYYDIEIRNEIIEPSGGFILGDCYGDLQGDSPFCSRITRDPADSTLSLIDSGFINRDILTARGVDLNMRVDWPTQIFGRAVDLAADFAFNRNLEVVSKFGGVGTEEEPEAFVGEFGYPEWNGRMTFRGDVGDWRYTWSTRYLSSVEQDAEGIDDFDNVFTGNGDTCLGPENGDVNCRDIGFADNYFVSDISVFYLGDRWTLGAGMRNVFNESPPFVDGSEVGSFNNSPRGRGYDIFGRELFMNVVFRTN